MNQPSPAIVAQEGVRRLPRWGLLLFCAVYVLFGFLWRDPWRRADISSFGIMLELAQKGILALQDKQREALAG